jgi:CoA:oxalate CoA-transferase
MQRPLSGLRVIDLTQVVSGAVTTMLLADFGADVIKVEPLEGEPYRTSGYEIYEDGASTNVNILRWSRGKRSVSMDLKSAEGKQILLDLIAKSDVLIENFRPGVLGRLGLDPEVLKATNPQLIYASVSGFGHDDLFSSPPVERPAYAIIVEAMAGLMHLARDTEGRPIWMGFAMADIFAGVLAFAGVILALLDQEIDDSGRRVDIAMFDGALFMNDLALVLKTTVGESLGPGQYLLQSPWGPFEVTDGHIVIAVLTQGQWEQLCNTIERRDLITDGRTLSGRERSKHHEKVVEPAIAAWCRHRSRKECTDCLDAAGVPAAPVNTIDDVLDHPYVAAREMVVDVTAPAIGQARVVGNPIKLGGRAAGGAATHVAQLGEDTKQLLHELLGLDDQQIACLVAAGVVRQCPNV